MSRHINRTSWAGLAWRVTGYYYRHLNEDEAFRADLASLFDRLDALFAQEGAPDPLEDEGWAMWEEAQHHSPDTLAELAEGPVVGTFYRLASSLRREVGAFISRWPLPRRIWRDLRWSYALRLRWGKSKGKRPRLELAPFFEALPTPGLPVVTDVRRIRGTRVQMVERRPWIFPSHPLPFLYDPLRQDRRWLEATIEAICRDVRESILAQATLYEEEVRARRPEPGPWRRRGDERWLAYLLYLRAVRRNTWEELTELTVRAGLYPSGVDADAVRKRVTALARLIGLPLAGAAGHGAD